MEHYFSKLQKSIKKYWDKDILCNYRGESFSCQEVATTIEKFHIFFKNAGIAKGDRIAVCARNSARWAQAFLSANTFEAVVVPILDNFHPDSMQNLLKHSATRILFTDADIWHKLDPDALPEIIAVVNAADFSLLYARTEAVEAAFNGAPAAFKAKYPAGFTREDVSYPECDLQELAVINYTSGTTSAPKGVMLRFECFSAMVDYCSLNMPINSEDSLVSILPMGHIFGLMLEFIYPVCNGTRVYYFGKTPSPTLLLQAMAEIRPYLLFSVPLVMEKVYKSSVKPVISKWYMKFALGIPVIGDAIYRKIGEKVIAAFGGRLHACIMGGAALNPETEEALKRMKFPYTVGYGMTEAAPLLAWDQTDVYVPGSCGKAITCVDIRIDSDDPEHIAGEIQAKGPNICSGYYNNPEASANAFTEDGYLRTGDLGIMDKNGVIFIKGRSKNMILTANGQNIYPEEVEAIINTQDYVAESVVVDRASKLVALVYLDADAIRKAKLDDEAIADIPDRIRVNSNRKLDSYSQLSKVEIVLTPFEKTPKMSIKRFLYK